MLCGQVSIELSKGNYEMMQQFTHLYLWGLPDFSDFGFLTDVVFDPTEVL